MNGRDQNDEISHEFRYASTVKKMSKIITVVMEKAMLDTGKWRELFGFQLHGNIYVDMSGEFYHEPYLNQQMKLLQMKLLSKGIAPFSTVNSKIVSLCD